MAEAKTIVSTTSSEQTISAISVILPAWLSARREFNTHLLTLWHLTYLSCKDAGPGSSIRAGFSAAMAGGNLLVEELECRKFDKFDTEFERKLNFIEIEFTKIKIAQESRLSGLSAAENILEQTSIHVKLAEDRFEEVCLVMIANYEKCLELAKTLDDQIDTNQTSLVQVCSTILKKCFDKINDFRERNSLVWISHFLFRVHQLLCLAKNYYIANTYNNYSPLTQLIQLDELFFQLAQITAKLLKHFTTLSPTSNAKAEMFQPIVPLATLISTLGENAKCAAEQIPTAVTAIIYEYDYSDPFCIDDAKLIQLKVSLSLSPPSSMDSNN